VSQSEDVWNWTYQDVEYIHVPLAAHETTHHTLDTAVLLDDLACCGVETFAWEHGVLLDHVCEGEKRWESRILSIHARHERNVMTHV